MPDPGGLAAVRAPAHAPPQAPLPLPHPGRQAGHDFRPAIFEFAQADQHAAAALGGGRGEPGDDGGGVVMVRGEAAEVDSADIGDERGQRAVPAVRLAVEVGVDQAEQGIEAALHEAIDPVVRQQETLELLVVRREVWIVANARGDEAESEVGVFELGEGQFAPDEPALEPARPGVAGGDEIAEGLRGVAQASEQHARGFFGHLAGLVDQHRAVLLRAQPAPVAQLAKLDCRGRAVLLLAAQRDALRLRAAPLDDQFARAMLEEFAHGGGAEVGVVQPADQDSGAGEGEGGFDGQFDQGAGLAAAHCAAVAEQRGALAGLARAQKFPDFQLAGRGLEQHGTVGGVFSFGGRRHSLLLSRAVAAAG